MNKVEKLTTEKIDLIRELFCDKPKQITWIERHGVSKAIQEHYANGRDQDEYVKFVNDTYAKNRKLKLLDGTYLASCMTYSPYNEWIDANTKIIIAELIPDEWSTGHESNDMPDFLKVPRFGIYDWTKLDTVSKKYGIRSVIRSFDQEVK